MEGKHRIVNTPGNITIPCYNCGGSGRIDLSSINRYPVKCSRCQGTGKISRPSLTENERRIYGVKYNPGVSAKEAIEGFRELGEAISEQRREAIKHPDWVQRVFTDETREAENPEEFSEPMFKPEWIKAAKEAEGRPSFDDTFMEIAGIVAKRGTCPRLKVGSVIAVDNRIIATGYNGSPAGLPHCTEVGCLEKCPSCRGTGQVPDTGWVATCGTCKGTGKAGGCKRTTHAEANALIQCARMGATPEGGTIYVTHRPCVACAGLIITAGLRRVVWQQDYKSDGLEDEVIRMFHTAGLSVEVSTDGANKAKAKA